MELSGCAKSETGFLSSAATAFSLSWVEAGCSKREAGFVVVSLGAANKLVDSVGAKSDVGFSFFSLESSSPILMTGGLINESTFGFEVLAVLASPWGCS